MTEPTHGTRRRYQRLACRCTPCRAANAAYWSTWHAQRHKGLTPLKACVSAVEAQRLIRLILKERYRLMALAQSLGVHHGLARLRGQRRVTLKTLLKVRRFYRLHVAEARPRTDELPSESA
jgi:hypothetical protein